MYVFLAVAVVLLVTSFFVEPRWLQVAATGLAAGSGALFLVSLAARAQDPNGPPGQH